MSRNPQTPFPDSESFYQQNPSANESNPISRRAFFIGSSTVLGATATYLLVPPSSSSSPPVPEDPTRVPGSPETRYGTRSMFEKAQRVTASSRSFTPLQDLHGIITPSALHFERHHNGVPLINPSRYRLMVHGLVQRPMIFTIDELKQFPAVSRLAFIECSGNSGREWRGPVGKTVQSTHGLTSTSEWTGVSLATVLREVGLKPEAAWMLAEGGDAAALTRSIPFPAIIQEAMLCYAQNGEPLRPEQGYPLRLLLPGWEGNANVKWLRRLKLMSGSAMTREETSKYTDLLPDGTARQFTFTMEAKSAITSPSGGDHLQSHGFYEIRGLAWSGRGRVILVEVSTDDGRTWQKAQLQDPVLPKCHTRFRMEWWWNGNETILKSRCVDETGYIQPSREDLVQVRGTQSYYHNNAIQSWKITSQGTVENV